MASPAPKVQASRPLPSWALVVALVFPSLLTWAYFVELADAPTAIQQLVYAGGKVVQFAFPAALVLVVTGRRPPIPMHWRRRVGEGFASGLAILAAIFGLWQVLQLADAPLLGDLLDNVRGKLVDLGIVTSSRYVALAFFYSLLHTFLEEYYWRWFVFGGLRRHVPFPAALILASLGFTAHHVIVVATYIGWTSPWTVLFSLAVTAGGAYWAWLYERSQSLVAPWISHIFVDLAIFGVGFLLVSRGLG